MMRLKRLVLVISLFTTLPLMCNETSKISLDLVQVFKGSPMIYLVLFMMSLGALTIWIYSLITFKISEMMPTKFMKEIKDLLLEKRYEQALLACQGNSNFSSKVVASGIAARRHGPQVMLDAMKAEGRRCSNSLWQRISILNDIAIVAPMLGLLGTVLGLFYAFYDINKTNESLSTLFDGLGIAIGTTVAGLLVAILSMIFYTTLKYKVVKLLNRIENEALNIGSLIETPQEQGNVK